MILERMTNKLEFSNISLLYFGRSEMFSKGKLSFLLRILFASGSELKHTHKKQEAEKEKENNRKFHKKRR